MTSAISSAFKPSSLRSSRAAKSLVTSPNILAPSYALPLIAANALLLSVTIRPNCSSVSIEPNADLENPVIPSVASAPALLTLLNVCTCLPSWPIKNLLASVAPLTNVLVAPPTKGILPASPAMAEPTASTTGINASNPLDPFKTDPVIEPMPLAKSVPTFLVCLTRPFSACSTVLVVPSTAVPASFSFLTNSSIACCSSSIDYFHLVL